MDKSKIHNYITNFNKLDYFLNKAYWHNLISLKRISNDSSKSIKTFITFLKENNFDYYIDEYTFQAFHSKNLFNQERYFESIILKPSDKTRLLENLNSLTENNFAIIKLSLRNIYLIKNKKIIKILFTYLPFLIRSSSINLDIEKIQSKGYRTVNVFGKIYFYRNIIFNKNFIYKKIRLFFNVKNKSKSINFKYLQKNDFLNICVESKKSINWLLRKPHLDIVTNNKKNITVRDILIYLKTSGSLENIAQKVIETDTTKKFEEPIHLNKKFWLSGNNYYIYPLIYGFKKNVVAYKEVNKYIDQNKEPMLFSSEYFLSLDDMSNNQIKELFENSPIEITNNAITSGRHRIFAMIGRMLRGEEFIPIYAKFID